MIGFLVGKNIPLYALAAIVVMIAAAVVLILFSNPAAAPSLTIVIGLIATSVPSLIAAVFSEKASRDIRNGVVEAKVKSGTIKALEETQVMTRNGPVATAQLEALAALIKHNTEVTQRNTDTTQTNTDASQMNTTTTQNRKEGDSDG